VKEIKKSQEQERKTGRMAPGFHNPTEVPVTGTVAKCADGKRSSVLRGHRVTVAAVGVPRPKELPGRFPGAEPYTPSASYRARGTVWRSG
jgi:hypothetical protein